LPSGIRFEEWLDLFWLAAAGSVEGTPTDATAIDTAIVMNRILTGCASL
jgi:hypothetical protein